MNLKPGDKVSFLNEKRDGTVVKVLNNKMVLVEIEDGFNIPVLEHDLVLAQAFEQNEKVNEISSKPSIEAEAEPEGRFAKRRKLGKTSEDNIYDGLYVAYVPEFGDKVLSSALGVYLINHNEFDTLFIYSQNDQGEYVCKDFDKMDGDSAFLLEVIDMSEIEKWNKIRFQFLFYKQDAALEKPPVVHEMHVKAVRFYKEESYKMYSFFNEKCFLVPLSEKEKTEPEVWDEKKWENSRIEKKTGIKIVGHLKDFINIEFFPEKHRIFKGVAEVDLHIRELVENFSEIESSEIMTIQMNYFVKMLESAIANRYRKITFIHGLGDGTLKLEIINKLRQDYPNLKYEDAPYSQYGAGATVVMIEGGN